MVFLFGFAFCILPRSFARLPCHIFHLVHTWATVSRPSLCSAIRRCIKKTGDRRISRKRRNVLVKKVCNAVKTSARADIQQVHSRQKPEERNHTITRFMMGRSRRETAALSLDYDQRSHLLTTALHK